MRTDPKKKRSAFAKFVTEHQASLRSFLRVIGVHPDSVDDLAQETFLIAFKELDRFNQDEDFGKWLRGIARNLTRNEIRKSARRQRILHEDLTEHLLAESECDASDGQYEDVDFSALRDCLEGLPEKSRLLISGRYADEWNSSFLADQYNMTATAVRLTLMRIRRQLKGCIQKRIQNA
ncbi:sigma-70 family RNA polymerase sigma factor [Pelagicoccus mobilis]|uniref:Sigma-70 family RNA polymerase sigma factor n=1 Tax=Pelagicoccus mobilis TaxID=415221 RepID=A0A934RR70_9BACT|nr:sigma-70 family RNA polymerase sigma factor [Pelagicoccus mobilis]MBK1876055.1 sigma-70 family RNA polymerase sigma factor [Pelagicoccus mobilis]